MRLTKTAGAIVIGGLMIGCATSGPRTSAPGGSALSASDEQIAADLQRTYRASHPGMQVGYVNAVDTGRRILSVAGIAPDLVRPGAIMTVLTNGGGTLQAIAYAKAAGYVQLRYEPLGPGQAGPATGELAVWNPGGPSIIPESVPPPEPQPTVVPTTTPTPVSPAPPPPLGAPAQSIPPATQPATDLQSPATRPAEVPPPTTETPPPPPPITPSPTTMPSSRPAPDINK